MSSRCATLNDDLTVHGWIECWTAKRSSLVLFSFFPFVPFFPFTLEVYLVLGGGGCVFVCFCPHGMQDLSSLTRDGTHAPCTGSVES